MTIESGIAIVPCPWCGSTFPLVHSADCYLVVTQQAAWDKGYKEGSKNGASDASAALSTALERYYAQDLQLGSLARQLRMLESFNSKKASTDHQPYRAHLAGAYKLAAQGIESILSKDDGDSSKAPTPSPIAALAQELTLLVEQWREFSNPFTPSFTIKGVVSGERILAYEALCRKTREALLGEE